MSNAVITQANGGVWSLAKGDAAGDNALVARYHDLSWLMEGIGGITNMAQSRAGVLTGPGTNGGATALFCSPTTGLNFQAYGGAAIVERGSYTGSSWSTFTPQGTGPYAVHIRAAQTMSVATASATSTRIDRVDLQVLDGPGYGDNSGVSLAQIIVTTGVAGSGSVPNGPANSIPLGYWTIPANTTTLTSGMWTDTRRSAAMRGAVRVLLPGDSLADPGYMHGELRDTSLIASIPTIDRWNAFQVTPAWETVTILGVGTTGARYQAAVNATGIGYNTSTYTANVFAAVQNSSPLVTPNGGFYQFTLNKTGWWSIASGNRAVPNGGATGIYGMISAASTSGGLFADGTRVANFGYPLTSTSDTNMGGSKYLAAGTIVSVGVIGTGAGGSIDRSATGTAERNWVSFNYEGP